MWSWLSPVNGPLVRGEYTELQHEHDGITTDAWQGSLDIVAVTIDSLGR
jgi:hypothetical protein